MPSPFFFNNGWMENGSYEWEFPLLLGLKIISETVKTTSDIIFLTSDVVFSMSDVVFLALNSF